MRVRWGWCRALFQVCAHGSSTHHHSSAGHAKACLPQRSACRCLVLGALPVPLPVVGVVEMCGLSAWERSVSFAVERNYVIFRSAALPSAQPVCRLGVPERLAQGCVPVCLSLHAQCSSHLVVRCAIRCHQQAPCLRTACCQRRVECWARVGTGAQQPLRPCCVGCGADSMCIFVGGGGWLWERDL